MYALTVLILKSLPPTGIKYLTQLFNSALLLGYVSDQWKVAQIILVLKPGKPPHELQSYRPISLLRVVSKVFEKLPLHRILPLVASNSLIPDHQFGFRKRHSTINQTHCLVQRIHTALDSKSNPSGPMVYNYGALLPPPTLKFWNDSNLRSCAWLRTPHGTSLIHSPKEPQLPYIQRRNPPLQLSLWWLTSHPSQSSHSEPSSAAWQQTPSPVSAYWSAWQILMKLYSF
jgi:hypothetical protein